MKEEAETKVKKHKKVIGHKKQIIFFTGLILIIAVLAAGGLVVGGKRDKSKSQEPNHISMDNKRKMEYLNRGVVAVNNGRNIYISWRLLATDEQDIAFDVYRITDGVEKKLNTQTVTKGTNFVDKTADITKENTYFVKAIGSKGETLCDGEYTLKANSIPKAINIPIKAGGPVHFVWVGDFDGDGGYDYLLDRCEDKTQKLEAYLQDGTYLWTIDMGYNSENKNNIMPGAATIDVGMWDGATVYDIDMDGYSEVLLRIADGVIMGDSTVFKAPSSHKNAQYIAVIDGRSGKLKDYIAVDNPHIAVGPMACMMGIGYLDGQKPSLVCYMKNRNKDKSFNRIIGAYTYENNKLVRQWQWEEGQNLADAHQIRIADVDYDGKDEIVGMGYCLNGDGTLRYEITSQGIVHGDRYYVGAFVKNSKQLLGYGIQQDNPYGLLEYIYNSATGEIIWQNKVSPQNTIDVGRGNVGDIDPRYEGFECWSFQGLYSNDGTKISDKSLYPVLRLWWDGDLLSESYNDGKIEKWDYAANGVKRLETTWKITDCKGSDRGVPMFYGDILGDWREEIVMTSSDNSELIILTTTEYTNHRIYTLAQNPAYRNCMTIKGYMQSHMLDYYLGWDMEAVAMPDISIISKKSLR